MLHPFSLRKITWNAPSKTVIYRSKRPHTIKRNFETSPRRWLRPGSRRLRLKRYQIITAKPILGMADVAAFES